MMDQDSLINKRLGKYVIQAEIGRGGMGAVYRGYDPDLERPVAVKVLAPHLVWQREFVERFLREARAAARLKHPAIVTIYDVGQESGWYYFVMEYLEGQTLGEMIEQRGPLPLSEVLTLLRPLAAALDYAHTQGIVHRDVKPDNIIVGSSGSAQLTDFGIARAAQETRMTSTGMIMGTLEYMSPEQAQGIKAEARSDQYSLAVVAYELLSGQVPFEADSTAGLLYKVAHEPLPSIRELRPDLPADVGEVLSRALAKSPDERYATATDFVEALEGQAVERPTSAPHAPPAREQQRVPVWGWALGGLVSLLLLFLILWGMGGFPVGLSSEEKLSTKAPPHTETPRLYDAGLSSEEKLGTEENPIIMSFVPSGDTQEILASGKELADMISEKTGLAIEVNVNADYAAVCEAMGAGKAHIGWLNTFSYMLANEKYGVEVGLVAERYGMTLYKGQINVRVDSGIASLADLKGKVMCWVDSNSTSGYIIPRIMLKANGIDPDTDFAQTVEAGSHDNVITQVYNGDCDAGATYDDARSSVEEDLPDVKEQVIILATTTDIPNDSVSFIKDFPKDMREDIINALLEIAQSEKGQQVLNGLYSIAGLQKAKDSFYDAFRADLNKAGIDIEELAE